MLTLAGEAPYSSTSWRASAGVGVSRRSAAATTRSSPASRVGGSGWSPSARLRFLTRPRVWKEWTTGLSQRSLASLATQPDTQ